MIRVRLSSGVETWKPSDLVVAVHEGHVDAMTPVSLDDGATWTTASVAALCIGTQKKQPVRPLVYPGAAFSWWFVVHCSGRRSGVTSACESASLER